MKKDLVLVLFSLLNKDQQHSLTEPISLQDEESMLEVFLNTGFLLVTIRKTYF